MSESVLTYLRCLPQIQKERGDQKQFLSRHDVQLLAFHFLHHSSAFKRRSRIRIEFVKRLLQHS